MKKGKLPSPHQRIETFGGAHKGAIVCTACGNYWYRKSWHRDARTFFAQKENKDIPVKRLLCPVDAMVQNKQYGGKITVANVPVAVRGELKNLVNGFCARAADRDALARLLSFAQNGSAVTILVSENRMAQQLAKKIADAFKRIRGSHIFGNPATAQISPLSFWRNNFILGKCSALVVQWTGHLPPKEAMQVRFLPRAQRCAGFRVTAVLALHGRPRFPTTLYEIKIPHAFCSGIFIWINFLPAEA